MERSSVPVVEQLVLDALPDLDAYRLDLAISRISPLSAGVPRASSGPAASSPGSGPPRGARPPSPPATRPNHGGGFRDGATRVSELRGQPVAVRWRPRRGRPWGQA